MTSVVEKYLERLVAHDWEGVGSCLSRDVVRVGPFGDTYSGKDSYLRFLSELMPTLQEYSMRVDRVSANDGCVLVELTETMRIEGRSRATPEALVFDLGQDGLISHISIYIQRHAAPAP